LSTYVEPIREQKTPDVSDPLVHVLVVDDQASVRELCKEIIESLGYRASTAEDGVAALAALEQEQMDIVLTDLKMPRMDGIELLSRVKEISPHTEVVLMTAYASIPTAVEAMRQGAYDYLAKPFQTEEVRILLERVVRKRELVDENRLLREQIKQGGGYGKLLGTHPTMQRLFRLMVKVSQNQYPVLIQGESGTGKELVARSIHENGPRARHSFFPVDCGALVPTLIESELFGHVRGAFTGASQTKPGLLEAAQGGTVFLDEIGDLPLDLQVKLLRALQEKEIRPVGSNRRTKIDVRVIAATHQDLEAAVDQGTFRKDLFYRLNVVNLRLPPLRERRSDISMLVQHFLDKFTAPGQKRPAVSEEAMRRLMAYDWPGNVRELENCIERAVALGSGPVLQTADLASSVLNARPHGGPLLVPVGEGQDKSLVPMEEGGEGTVPLAELERRAIFRAIADAGGDKLMAARLLGIGKTTLYRKLKEYNALQ